MSHEIDDPCLKSIMLFKTWNSSDDNEFLSEYAGLMKLYNALKFITLLYSIS